MWAQILMGKGNFKGKIIIIIIIDTFIKRHKCLGYRGARGCQL